MQMLQQFLGEQGARYAVFVLIALALFITILFVWVLIRKALGSRLNFSEKPDRRGRAPRLGITESFNVDREGRRLVIVRRDNFEHLVMIGGPNDVVIETNILRGERLTVGRNDQRLAEAELLPAVPRQITESIQPALSAPLPPSVSQKAPAPNQPAPIPAKLTPQQPDPVLPPPALAVKPAALPTQPPVETSKPSIVDLPNLSLQSKQSSSADVFSSVVSTTTTSQNVAANAKEAVKKILMPVTKPDEISQVVAQIPLPKIAAIDEQPSIKPLATKPTLAERIKSGSFFNKKSVAVEPPPPPVTASKIMTDVQGIKLQASETLSPVITTPPVIASSSPERTKPSGNSFMAEMKQLDEASRTSKSPEAGFTKNISPTVSSEIKSDEITRMQQTLRPRPPVSEPPVKVEASLAPLAPTQVRPVSKNPFDSLEEEMAKLLGRTPDGKG